MREFGRKAGAEIRGEIAALAQLIFERAQPKRAVKAHEFAMEEDPDRVVVHEVDLRPAKGEGDGRMRIAVTEADARPPFEWLLEITSDIDEEDYFKHYLVREDDIVLAQRKVLTPIDEAEAKLIMGDLRVAQRWLT